MTNDPLFDRQRAIGEYWSKVDGRYFLPLPSRVPALPAKLDARQVYHKAEVEEFSKVFYKPRRNQTPTDHARMNACIDPAVGRFNDLDEVDREEFCKTPTAFRNLYSFLSQVIPFQDTDLEKLCTPMFGSS